MSHHGIIRVGDRVAYRVGGPDDDPELRPADVARIGDHGLDLGIVLAGVHDRDWTGTDGGVLFAPPEYAVGHAVKYDVPQGHGVGQWRPR